MNQTDIIVVVVVLYLLSTGAIAYFTRKIIADFTRYVLGTCAWTLLWVLVVYIIFRVGFVGNLQAGLLILIVASPLGFILWTEFLNNDEDENKNVSLEDRIKKMLDDSKK